jgi:hypothetical protein
METYYRPSTRFITKYKHERLLMKYDKNKYVYLLEQEEILRNQGGSLYKANQEDYLELLNYQVQLEDHNY